MVFHRTWHDKSPHRHHRDCRAGVTDNNIPDHRRCFVLQGFGSSPSVVAHQQVARTLRPCLVQRPQPSPAHQDDHYRHDHSGDRRLRWLDSLKCSDTSDRCDRWDHRGLVRWPSYTHTEKYADLSAALNKAKLPSLTMEPAAALREVSCADYWRLRMLQ